MKLEINKERLIATIQKAEKIANKNTTLPILSCLILEAKDGLLKIKTTNLDISLIATCNAKILKDGIVAIPAQTISSYVSNLPKTDTVVNLEMKNNILNITTKSSNTSIKTHPTDDFPEIKEKTNTNNIIIKPNVFINGLNSVWYSSSTSSIKPELSSVYLYQEDGGLVFVATDSFRLAEKKIIVDKVEDFKDVLIPYKNVIEIIRIFDDLNENIELSFQEDQIIIRSENIYVSSRIVDGSFPDYKQIIPKETKTEVDVLKEDFIQSIKISNIFAGKFNQVVFSIAPKDNLFEIQSNSQDLGETKNIVKSKTKGEDIKVSFNSKYINDCLSSIKSETVNLRFCGLDKPMIIKSVDSENFTYLVMPMNK